MTPWPMLFWPRRSWQTMTKGEGGHFLDYWGNEKEVSSLNLVNIFWGTIKIKAVTHQNLFLLFPWLFTNKYLPFNFNFSKPTSRNWHNADFKYNSVHLKQIHQHIRVKSISTIHRLLCPWTELISQKGSSWKWQGWGTFSGSLDPSKPRSSATWWRRRPSSLMTPAPRLHGVRSPQPVSTF